MVGEARLLKAYSFLTPEAVFTFARDDAGSYGDAILAAVTHHAAAQKAMLALKQVVMRRNKRRVLEVVEAAGLALPAKTGGGARGSPAKAPRSARGAVASPLHPDEQRVLQADAPDDR